MVDVSIPNSLLFENKTVNALSPSVEKFRSTVNINKISKEPFTDKEWWNVESYLSVLLKVLKEYTTLGF